MNVLMITPGVDESQDILGFTASWVRELSKRVAKLYVITPYFNKETILPANSIVYGLNEKPNKLTRYLYLSSIMLKLLSQKQVDVIFCHIGPSSVLWVAPWAKLFRVPIVTWYSHKAVSWRLRLADVLASRVVTASEESYHLKSNKVIITGHGVETDKFKPAVNLKREEKKTTILSVARISPVRDYETLIRAVNILVNEKDLKDLEVVLVGGVPSRDQDYGQKLKEMVKEFKLQDYVNFVGAVPHGETVKYYQTCDIFVHNCGDAGLGKAMLEAMACEKPAVVCSEVCRKLLHPYDELCLFKIHDPASMAQKLATLLVNRSLWPEIGKVSRERVVETQSIAQLADKLVNIFGKLSRQKEAAPRGARYEN